MKHLHKLLCLTLVLLAATFTACERDYDMPPLNEPQYSLPADAQTITISELREKYAAATSSAPITIEDSLWLRARIGGDDRSGNIYKSIYVQDETGGIAFLIDQSNVYTDFSAGQEVLIDLKGLCISVYGKEQQIGHPDGYLYRTPYETFKEHVHANGWADESKLNMTEISNISKLSDNVNGLKFTVVRFTGVHFEEAGTTTFAESDGYGTHNLVDAYGNTISVRTSNYADFAATTLPIGTGNVIGIVGRYNGAWQLSIRSEADIYGFDGIPVDGSGDDSGDDEADGTVIFSENFGSTTVTKDGNYWPYVSAYTGWTSGLTFTDVNGKTLSVRAQGGVNNIWFPASKECDLKIEGIKAAGYTSLTLSYEVAANLYGGEGEQDAAALKGSFNGHAFSTPSQVLSGPNGDNNKFYSFSVELDASDATDSSELHFTSAAADNTKGLRLANIKLVGKK